MCSPQDGKLLHILIVIFAENASFRSYGVICLPQMPQNTDTNGIHAAWGMTLLFAILTKNASFRSYSTFVYLLRAHILNINMRTYITSAHEHELSGCVRTDAYNLILIFTRIIMLPGPGPGPVLCMIRERHVILKVVLHTRLAV